MASNNFPTVINGGPVDADAWYNAIAQAVTAAAAAIAASSPTQQISQDTSWSVAGTLASSSGAEVALAAWTGASAQFLFKAGECYRLDLFGCAFDVGAAGSASSAIVRVRKGVNTIVGQQLGYFTPTTRGASSVGTFSGFGFIVNATAADITTELGVTVQKLLAANVGIYGDSNMPFMVTVTRVGTATVVPNIAAVAVPIT